MTATVGDITMLPIFLFIIIEEGRMFPRGLNAINCYAINNTTYLQEETGSSPKWVTRFQQPEFLLNHSAAQELSDSLYVLC